MVKALAMRLRAVTEDADFEARVILESVFGRDFRLRKLKGELAPTAEQLAQVEDMTERRLSGEPLQYILGEWEFYGLDFEVGRGVLIPRQDTETLVESAAELLKNIEKPRVLDLCAGSGCVAAAIKSVCPEASVTALEYSPDAYAILERNAAKYGVETVLADALDSVSAQGFCGLDLITANPPYLTAEDMRNLQREVKKEPEMALLGGDDGLRFYRELPKIWRRSLKTGGFMAVEIGLSQEAEVGRLFEESGFSEIRFINDLTERVRVVIGKNESKQSD